VISPPHPGANEKNICTAASHHTWRYEYEKYKYTNILILTV